MIALLLALQLTNTTANGTMTIADDPVLRHGQIQWITPKYPCDGIHYIDPWVAAFPVHVTNIQIWPGADADIQAGDLKIDAYVSLYASRPAGYLLAFHALDRYAEPNGPIDKEQPRNFPLAAGDSIGGGIHCSPIVGQSHIQAIIIVSYEKD